MTKQKRKRLVSRLVHECWVPISPLLVKDRAEAMQLGDEWYTPRYGRNTLQRMLAIVEEAERCPDGWQEKVR
jgi:hypothetical protein